MSEAVFTLSIKVGKESIDRMEHVNNIEYLKWMEKAAIAHAEAHGWDFQPLKDRNLGWVAREHWIEYLRPAFMGDELLVHTWVQSAKRFSTLRRYAVMRGRELLAVGATEWVMVNFATRRPAPIPAELEKDFRLIAADAPELKALGISRMVRFAASPGL